MPTWPDWFPEDCPAKEASPAAGVVYRLVSHNPPTSADLLPAAVIPKHPRFQDFSCQNCGLSVFRDLMEVRRLSEQLPRFQAMRIAVANLDDSGIWLAETPSRKSASHCTLWVPTTIEVVARFAVVD